MATHPSIKAILDVATEIGASRADLAEQLNTLADPTGARFQLENSFPGDPGCSFENLDKQLLALQGLIAGLAGTDTSALVPIAAASNSASNLRALSSMLNEAAQMLKDAQAQGVSTVNAGSWTFVRTDGNEIPFGNHLRNAANKIGEILDHLGPVVFLAGLR